MYSKKSLQMSYAYFFSIFLFLQAAEAREKQCSFWDNNER